MRTTPRILIGISVVAVAIFIATTVHKAGPSEPTFQNKPLGEWLTDYAISTNGNRVAAETAIRAIGTNALPFLFSELQATESPQVGRAKRKVEQHLQKRIISGVDRANIALAGFEVLGTSAVSAVPELIGLFKDADPYLGGHDPAYQAVRALRRIGPLAIPQLISATTNENEMVRVHACFTLAELGATQAIPALVARLSDGSRMVRIRAAVAIGKLHADDEQTVQALTAALDDRESAVRCSAASALGVCGPRAGAAVPKLQQVLTEELKRPAKKPSKGAIFEEKAPSEVVAAIRAALIQIASPSASNL